MSEFQITQPQDIDLPDIFILYKAVAANEGGLARKQSEISENYVRDNYFASRDRGLSFIARVDGAIAGEIHSYRPVPQVFSHVLSDLTIAVHPDYQNRGVGKRLFTSFLNEVETNHPSILRVELIARESNQRAIQFYQTLGFSIEGRMLNRIRSVDRTFEADIPMAWHRKS